MSCADDVMEMQSICDELAGKLTLSQAWKDRIAALHAVFRDDKGQPLITWNRAYEFLSGKARRVDSWEKDFARNELQKHEAAERRREAANLVGNLNRTVAYLRSTDPDGHRHDIAAIERTLGLAGVFDRALAETTDSH